MAAVPRGRPPLSIQVTSKAPPFNVRDPICPDEQATKAGSLAGTTIGRLVPKSFGGVVLLTGIATVVHLPG
jgi:hypothetical protein